MLKQIIISVLLTAFMLQTLNRVVVYIDYYTNMAAYIKNCENKALPLMHCNGKCQMMKKLLQEEKKDSQLPERKSSNDEIIVSTSSFSIIDSFFSLSGTGYNIFPDSHITSMPRTCFHPPGYLKFA